MTPKENIYYTLKSFSSLYFIQEYKFLENRRFKFDYAIPYLKVGIEYEGVISSKSRHTTISGYTKDCEKYNLAAINGWRVLRYTALNYKDLAIDLKAIIETYKVK